MSVQTLNNAEQEKCRSTGQVKVLTEMFKPQQNETIMSLQYYKSM